MKITKLALLLASFALVAGSFTTGCTKSDEDKAVDSIENAADTVKEKTTDAAEGAAKAVEDAADAVEDEMN